MRFVSYRLRVFLLLLGMLLFASAGSAEPVGAETSLNSWLVRMHEASRKRAYTGTFVVSAGAKTVSAKIWHVCDGTQQMERVESLSGPPRSTFRRNEQVLTKFPEAKVEVAESRDSLGLFPNLLKASNSDLGEFYQLKRLGNERIVGLEAEVVQLVPKDKLRYGYRVWSEKRTGLVVQLQTLGLDGRVLEQSAFSELQLDAPVSMVKLSQMMGATQGYRVEHAELQKTAAEAHGWSLSKAVGGYKPVGCYQRPLPVQEGAGDTPLGPTLQWMFSDGLATVSLFIEPFQAPRHMREGAADLGGATRIHTRHIDTWWVTAVGEVPAATLNIFSHALERRK